VASESATYKSPVKIRVKHKSWCREWIPSLLVPRTVPQMTKMCAHPHRQSVRVSVRRAVRIQSFNAFRASKAVKSVIKNTLSRFLRFWKLFYIIIAGTALVLAINWPCRMKMETDVRTYSHEHRVIVHNVKHVSNPNSVRAKRVALRFGVGRVLL
jgi:hypothetical protein